MASTEVRREDQERINEFSRLNTRRHEIEAEISARKASLEDIEEAGNELMLADDEEIPFVVGECFLRVSQEEAEERLKAAEEADAEAVGRLEGEKKDLEVRMDALKKVLYAHFGNAINLEEALGLIADEVPFAVQRRGRETYITTSIGKAFKVYNAAKLNLELLSSELDRSITALVSSGDLTYAAQRGGTISEFRRLHRTRLLRFHRGSVVSLVRLGPVIASVGADGWVCLWDALRAEGAWKPAEDATLMAEDGADDEGDEAAARPMTAAPAPAAAPGPALEAVRPRLKHRLPAGFVPTCACHPPTYVNKLLIGDASGRLLLLNVATGTVLHSFGPDGEGFGAGVCCVEPSSALDVVGLGLEDGRAIILDVRRDEVLSTFTDAAGAGAGADALLGGSRAAAGARARAAAARAVRALAFGQGAGAAGGAGSDAAAAAASGAAGRRAPLLAAGGDAGSIVLWDLEQGRLAGVAPRAHAGRVTSLHWFAGEPRIASSGADNALRQWAADSPGASPRPLRERAGHAAPPLRCLFHGDEGEASAVLALCAEADPATVRIHSTRKEDRGRAFGEGARAGLGAARARRLGVEAAELLPSRGVAIASAALRSREWDDCVTAHEGEAAALTWSTDRGARGDHLLGGARAGATTGAGGGYLSADASTTLAPATCVAVTRDGNFAYVGRANGAVDRWNVQSGVARGGLVRKQADPADGVALAHDGRVVAVFHAPAAGRVLTAGADGVARVWGARSLALEGEVALGSPAAAAHVDLAGRLAAVACDDLAIRVLDLETLRIVRRFEGHTDRLTDVHLSPDRWWLLSASMDGTVRVWDLPGGRVLQTLTMGPPVTSLSLSPSGDLLATTHVGKRAVFLWSNAALADPDGVEVSAAPRRVALPGAKVEADEAAALERGREGRKPRAVASIAGRKARAEASAEDGALALDGSGSDSDASASSSVSLLSSSSESSWWSGASDSDAESPSSHLSDAESRAARRDARLVAAARRDARRGGPGGDLPEGPRPLSPRLATLSGLPRSRTVGLASLERIRARDRPLEPAKKPEAAPFFLPTVQGANQGRAPVFDLAAKDEREGESDDGESDDGSDGGESGSSSSSDEEEPADPFAPAAEVSTADPAGAVEAWRREVAELDARAARQDKLESTSSDDEERGGVALSGPDASSSSSAPSLPPLPPECFVPLLARCRAAGDWTSAVAALRALPPARAHLALVSASGPAGVASGAPSRADRRAAVAPLCLVLEFFLAALASNGNVDLVNAALVVFLDAHAELLAGSRRLARAARAVRAAAAKAARRFEDDVESARALAGYLADASGLGA